jgi:hypothetical protein
VRIINDYATDMETLLLPGSFLLNGSNITSLELAVVMFGEDTNMIKTTLPKLIKWRFNESHIDPISHLLSQTNTPKLSSLIFKTPSGPIGHSLISALASLPLTELVMEDIVHSDSTSITNFPELLEALPMLRKLVLSYRTKFDADPLVLALTSGVDNPKRACPRLASLGLHNVQVDLALLAKMVELRLPADVSSPAREGFVKTECSSQCWLQDKDYGADNFAVCSDAGFRNIDIHLAKDFTYENVDGDACDITRKTNSLEDMRRAAGSKRLFALCDKTRLHFAIVGSGDGRRSP